MGGGFLDLDCDKPLKVLARIFEIFVTGFAPIVYG